MDPSSFMDDACGRQMKTIKLVRPPVLSLSTDGCPPRMYVLYFHKNIVTWYSLVTTVCASRWLQEISFAKRFQTLVQRIDNR